MAPAAVSSHIMRHKSGFIGINHSDCSWDQSQAATWSTGKSLQSSLFFAKKQVISQSFPASNLYKWLFTHGLLLHSYLRSKLIISLFINEDPKAVTLMPEINYTDDFSPVEGREEAAGRQHEGSLRQQSPSVVHPVQISSGHVGHADGSGRTVQELVTIPEVSRYLFID